MNIGLKSQSSIISVSSTRYTPPPGKKKSVKLIDTLKNIRTNDDYGDYYFVSFKTVQQKRKQLVMACI